MTREQFDEFRNAILELTNPDHHLELVTVIQLLGHSLTGGWGAESDVPELINGYNPTPEEVFSAVGWVLERVAPHSR